MPITKIANVITETPAQDMDQFLRTGVIHSSQFALCDYMDRLKQISFDASPLAAGGSLVIAAPAASTAVTITLPLAGGVLAAQSSPYQYATPTAGSTVTIAANTPQLVLEPAGTLATLTIVLPTAPADGYLQNLSSTAIVTALTLSGGGSDTVVNAISALTAGGFAQYLYKASTTKWYRVG